MAAQANNKKGVAGIMNAKGKKTASDRNGPSGMSSRGTWPPVRRVIHYGRGTLLAIGALALITGFGLIAAGRATAQTFTVLHSFTATDPNTRANSDGADPYAALIISGNTLYGTVVGGGSSGNGTVYKVITNGTGFTNLHSFTALPEPRPHTNSDGAYPIAGLITNLSGNTVYGTASEGGKSGNGTVFAVNTDGTGFTNLYSFTASSRDSSGAYTNSDGSFPNSLILSVNTLYGTASQGGSSGYGTVFALNTDGTGFTNLHSFTSGSDGGLPYAGLILSGNTMYGTADGGGDSGGGTVFKINTDGSGFKTLYNFGPICTNALGVYTNSGGAIPLARLFLSGNTLYGTAAYGGSSGAGTVFAVATDGTGFSNLHTFTESSTNSSGVYTNSDGAYPDAGLILSGNTLYGTAQIGGSSGNGTVFSISLPRPRLTITFSGTYPVVSWPAIYSGQYLQYTTDALSPSAVWYNLPYLPIIVNGQIAVTGPSYLFLREHAAFRLYHD